MNSSIKTYVLVGCGGRGLYMFAEPIVKRFSHTSRLVGLCDINPGRMAYFNKFLGTDIPTFTDFDKMMKKTKPDMVMIATKDVLHCKYILHSFDYGCDVICEKPMAIDEKQCRKILKAEKKSGRKVVVTFNL